MKYIAQTFSYLKKNFPLPLLVMLVPAVATCFLSTPYWEVSFMSAYEYDPFVPVGRTFEILFSDSWHYVWPVIVICILQIAAASLVMSAVDRHFRTGRMSLRSPWRLMNMSVFPIGLGVLLMCVIGILLRFVLFGLVSLVQTLATVFSLDTVWTFVLISIIAVGLFAVHVMIITPMLYWAPIMFIYGYKLRDAAATSFKMLPLRKLYTGLLVMLLPCATLQLLMGFLNAPEAVNIAVGFVVALFTNLFVTVYVIVTFYNISGLDRRDVVTYAAIPKPQAPAAPAQSAAPAETAATAVGTEEQPAAAKKPPAKSKKKKKEREEQKDKPSETGGDGNGV